MKTTISKNPKLSSLYIGEAAFLSDPELLYALAQRDDVEHVWIAPIDFDVEAGRFNYKRLNRPYDEEEVLRVIDIKPLMTDVFKEHCESESMTTDLFIDAVNRFVHLSDAENFQPLKPSEFDGMLQVKTLIPVLDDAIQRLFKHAWSINDMQPHHALGDKKSLTWLPEAFAKEISQHHAGGAKDELQLFLPTQKIHDFESAEQWMRERGLSEAILKPRNGLGGYYICKLRIENDRLMLRYEHPEKVKGFIGEEEKEIGDGVIDVPADEFALLKIESLDVDAITLEVDAITKKLDRELDKASNVACDTNTQQQQGDESQAEIQGNYNITEHKLDDNEAIDLKRREFESDTAKQIEACLQDGMLIQPCLDVSKGDIRVIIAGGQVIGAYNRMPPINQEGRIGQIASNGSLKVPVLAEGFSADKSQCDLGFADMMRLNALAKMLQREPYQQNLVMLDMLSDANGRRFVTEINAARSDSIGYLCASDEQYDFSYSRMEPAKLAANALVKVYRQQHLNQHEHAVGAQLI